MSRVLIASITELCTPDHHDDPAAIAAWTANKTPAGVAAMLASPKARLFVASEDGAIAAVGCILGEAEIGLNYVDPTRRFTGVSQALMSAMEETMRAGGVTEAHLHSTATARRFYRDAGWVEAGDPEVGRFGTALPMRKTL